MPERTLPPGIQGLLVQRLRAIPDGRVTETARRADFPLTALLRLRRGQATNIKLDSLERLARGLQITPSELIAGEPGTELPPQVQRGVDPRMVRSLIKQTRAFVERVEQFVEALPAEPESSARPAPGRRGARDRK